MNFLRPLPLPTGSIAAWVLAAGVFLAALAVRFAFSGVVPSGIAFASFIPAIILVAYFSGLRPALATLAASTLAGWYFFLAPTTISDAGDFAYNIGPFLVISAIAIAIIQLIRSTLDALNAERRRSAALAEQREILFRELQHRVSNNLAIVSALLNLQRSQVKDETARQALTEASTRLALIAKIHRRLHDPAGAELRFGPFVEDLCRDVLEAAGVRNIVCLVSAADATISPDKLIPVALIVTELISNALEHGFAGRAKGTIRVDLTPEGTDHILTIADDGNGLPTNFSLDSRAGTGLRIVQALAQQIEGRFAIENGRGTTCRVVFQTSAVAA
jgi:two-component sensor histidine kinase